jgi:hypothetical protein
MKLLIDRILQDRRSLEGVILKDLQVVLCSDKKY